MDAKTIETLSINAVKNSIVRTDFLDQFIADNDKEPSWDGFIYIYKDKSKRKDKLKGRLPVQVKGTVSNDFSKDEISFQTEVVDLKNYLYDGGVVFFVVYIGTGGLTEKIYYAELTPIKLRFYLKQGEGQASKSIKLRTFPTDNNEKASVFLNCLQNCQKQASFTDAKLLTLEEMEREGLLESITVPVSGIGIKDPQLALLRNEVYLYANVRGSSIPQPLDLIPSHMVTYEERNIIITVKEKLFYSKVNIVKTADSVKYIFGQSLSLNFTDENKICKIKYTNSSKLRALTIDLDFIIAYIEEGAFQMNGINVPFDSKDADFSNFNIAEQKNRLCFAKRAVQTFDILGCHEEIDLKELNDEDFRNLERLITAFIDKKPVDGLNEGLPTIVKMNVGKLTFALNLQKVENKDLYNIYDFFRTEILFEYQGPKGDRLPISQYCILAADDLLSLNNIKLEVLLPSFQKVESNYDKFNRINCFLLELLIAYDKSNGTRGDILITAHDFADLILTASDEELDSQVKLLNYLQVIKRERDLDYTEIESLYKLVEDISAREDSIVGAYLLLNQQHAAEIHFGRLKIEQQKEFESYPIYHFWKTK